MALSQKLIADIQKYIDEHKAKPVRRNRKTANLSAPLTYSMESVERSRKMEYSREARSCDAAFSQLEDYEMACSLEDYILIRDVSFHEKLFTWIDQKNMLDTDVYHKAGLDRKLFSRIRSDENFHPSKETAICLCFGLELNLEESQALLRTASYTLSDSSVFDKIIKYYLEHRTYDLLLVNESLNHWNQRLLVKCK